MKFAWRTLKIIVIVILILVFQYDSLMEPIIRTDLVKKRMERYLDSHPDVDIIRLDDFTWGPWDSVLVYYIHTSEYEIEESTKLPFPPVTVGLRPGFVLYRGDKIVYFERGWSGATDVYFRTVILPYRQDEEACDFCLLTREEAVFYVERSYRGIREPCAYILYPCSDLLAEDAAG